jgi:hypothetical protein
MEISPREGGSPRTIGCAKITFQDVFLRQQRQGETHLRVAPGHLKSHNSRKWLGIFRLPKRRGGIYNDSGIEIAKLAIFKVHVPISCVAIFRGALLFMAVWLYLGRYT